MHMTVITSRGVRVYVESILALFVCRLVSLPPWPTHRRHAKREAASFLRPVRKYPSPTERKHRCPVTTRPQPPRQHPPRQRPQPSMQAQTPLQAQQKRHPRCHPETSHPPRRPPPRKRIKRLRERRAKKGRA